MSKTPSTWMTWIPALEIVAFVALLSVPWPVPAAIPLFTMASLSVWLRGGSWERLLAPSPGNVGFDLGLGVALGALVQVLLFAIAGSALDLNLNPIMRGNAAALVTSLLLIWVGAAMVGELLFRGYLLQRFIDVLTPWMAEDKHRLRLGPIPDDDEPPEGEGGTGEGDHDEGDHDEGDEVAQLGVRIAATLLAAVAFGWYVANGHPHDFLGGTFAGLGYGLLYWARGSLVLPIAFHGAMESTIAVLTYLRLT